MTDTTPKPNVQRLYECLTDGRYDEASTTGRLWPRHRASRSCGRCS